MCICGKKRTANVVANGYQNLKSHIVEQHPNYEDVMHNNELSNEQATSQGTLQAFVCKKATHLFSWLEWIVMESREFIFAQKPLVRKYTNLKKVCTKTVMKYMLLVTEKVEAIIARELPYKICIDARWMD